MQKTNVDPKTDEKIPSRLPYEKPNLKAVDLHADEIMGGCQDAPPCTIIPDPGSPGPVSGIG